MTHLLLPIAAAAKSLQSCPTLGDPIDGSPPGSPVPGILQARTKEWAAISFSSAWKWKVKVKSLSHVRLLPISRAQILNRERNNQLLMRMWSNGNTHCWCKIVPPLWEAHWRLLKKLKLDFLLHLFFFLRRKLLKEFRLRFWDVSELTGEGTGTPLQYSRLKNPMDGRSW